MDIREAVPADIAAMQAVRHSVVENRLTDNAENTEQASANEIPPKGRGWVCEIQHAVVAFAIADPAQHNIRALFVRPEYENKGIGSALLRVMLDWYFAQREEKVWLSTAPNTRAAGFFAHLGWEHTGFTPKGELIFHKTKPEWEQDSRA